MINKKLYINVSVANVYRDASFSSEVVTQALLGEKVEVLKNNEKWILIRQWDGYEGWIHYFFAVYPDVKFSDRIDKNTKFKIGDLFTQVHKEPDSSSTVVRDLVYGNEIAVLNKKNGWTGTILPDGEIGWTSARQQNTMIRNMRDYLVRESKRFLGIQYLWGGKSPKGFDCSGFIQTVMKSAGINLPRDSYLQEDYPQLESISFGIIEKGDLVFFSDTGDRVNHVAMSIGRKRFIHCSGLVKIGSFDEKDSLFNKKLMENITSIKSIKRWCR